MDTHFPANMNALYIERLQQAVRVMEGLSDVERWNFNIYVIAVRRESGISACIAGYCGLDPWFQAQGFATTVDEDEYGAGGDISCKLSEFFGTDEPFFSSGYAPECAGRNISVDDAIAALKKAIASFGDNPSTEVPVASVPAAA